jgi:hypothetical protein
MISLQLYIVTTEYRYSNIPLKHRIVQPYIVIAYRYNISLEQHRFTIEDMKCFFYRFIRFSFIEKPKAYLVID